MAPSVSFFSDNFPLTESGLGFYGSTFGQSVAVGAYQNTTFLTNPAGTLQGPQTNNNRFDTASTTGCFIGSASAAVKLKMVPNYLASLQIRTILDSPGSTQNNQIRIYDRLDTGRAASGVTTKLAEVIHTDPVQTMTGSGSIGWTTFSGGALSHGQVFNLGASPGISGTYNIGASVSDRKHSYHDHYVLLSASPDTIGSKTSYGLYFSCEYY